MQASTVCPILLTTATSLGLLPLCFGGGLMWEPMAISIIFGLLFATVLAFLFIPVLYSVLYRVDFEGYSLEGISEEAMVENN